MRARVNALAGAAGRRDKRRPPAPGSVALVRGLRVPAGCFTGTIILRGVLTGYLSARPVGYCRVSPARGRGVRTSAARRAPNTICARSSGSTVSIARRSPAMESDPRTTRFRGNRRTARARCVTSTCLGVPPLCTSDRCRIAR
jgi:hypothetical protein